MTGERSHLPWVDHTALTPAQQKVLAASEPELMERVAFVHRLYKTGALAEEALSLGIAPRWLDTLHREGPKVLIDEQPQPLPNLFTPLDKYGTPSALVDSFPLMQRLRGSLADALGVHVGAGLIVSPFHEVSFNSVSYGGYVTLPKGVGDEHEKLNLFTGQERKHFEHATYSDLMLSPKKLEEVTTKLAALHKLYDQQLRSKTAAHDRHAAGTVDAASLEPFKLQVEFAKLRLSAVTSFLSDWKAAIAQSSAGASKDEKIAYIAFVANYNDQFARRVAPLDLGFRTHFNEAVELFPSKGITNWPLLIGKLVEAGVLEIGKAVAHVRTEGGARPRYCNAWLEEVTPGGVIVSLKSDGLPPVRHDIVSLAERSAAAVDAGQIPTLVPVGKLRYLVNLAFSPSLYLCDGVEFKPVVKVTEAMGEGGILQYPRGPKIHAYSSLWQHAPEDTEHPWTGLKETNHYLDYYQFLESRRSQGLNEH